MKVFGLGWALLNGYGGIVRVRYFILAQLTCGEGQDKLADPTLLLLLSCIFDCLPLDFQDWSSANIPLQQGR